jgi:hypothetical protein
MNKVYAVIALATCLTLFSIFGLPFVFSAITGIPVWFLFPKFYSLSIFSTEGVMTVKLNSTVPETIGEYILVTVLDAKNNAPIENALVKIDEGSFDDYNRTTGPNGTTQFPYIGSTTQIFVSKEGYANADPIVIPQIPADWVTTRNYQYLTFVVMLMCAWGPAFYLYKKQEKRPSTKRRRRKKSGTPE